jgi:antitoxin HicB
VEVGASRSPGFGESLPRRTQGGRGTAAFKELVARQLAAAMKEQGLTKVEMAERMKTSRAQIDRLLDPKNSSATLETLMRAAKVVDCGLRLELIPLG